MIAERLLNITMPAPELASTIKQKIIHKICDAFIQVNE